MAHPNPSCVFKLTALAPEPSIPVHPTVRAPKWLRTGVVLIASALSALAAPPPSVGGPSARELAQGYRDGRVLAMPRQAMLQTIDQVERGEGLRVRARFERFGHVGVLQLAPGDTVPAAISRLMATGRYEYVEPDYIRRGTGTLVVPNDAQFGSQWALNNTGNNGDNGGIAGADIHAEAGWETITSASGIIVGMVDSGALTTHQDLMANLWVNPNPGTTTAYASVSDATGQADTVTETDSLNGLNAVAMTGIPTDDLGHGTHTSGIVGAVGNNGIGVTGVAWKVQLMELKFIGSDDEGSTSDELPCIEYAIDHKVSVMNASFGDTSFSQSEMNAIAAAGKAGIIFVCSAGNSAENIDISPFFPADYPLDNIICVGATDNRDLPVYFSNYGSGSVETFAPGENVISTFNTSTSAYAYESGTSMSAPFVTGTVALLRAQFPGDTYRETINRVLNAADTNPGLAGKAQTGGRLDLATALTTAANTPPNALFANRTTLVGLDPYTRSNNADSPAALEAGTPSLGTGAGHPLWWQWTAPENATVEIDTSGTGGGVYPGGSNYPTALGVYTGSSLGSLTQVASNSDFSTEPPVGGGANIPYSEVTFPTTAGTTYQINVQGLGGASGQTILAINTTPNNDNFAQPEVLTGASVSLLGANINATLQAGEPTILGNRGGHSLWYSWTAPATGTVQVSGYSYDFVPEVAVYTGTSITSLSTVASAAGNALAGTTTDISECLCTINATAGTTYLIAVDGMSSSDIGEFTLTLVDSQWQTATGDAVTCSPAVGPDGTVYVGSNDNSLYAFGPGGTVKWSQAGQSIFDTSSAAIGTDGTIYAGNYDGNVYAFNPDGTTKWTYSVPGAAGSGATGNSITSSPALASDGTVYAHASDGNLYALTSSGSLKWTAAVSGESYAAPTIAPDGTIYIGTDSGTFYAINPDGSQKWAFTAPVSGEPIYTSAAIDSAGNLYFGTLSGNFYSVSSSGTLRWTYAVGDGISSAPALANGAVYFGGYDGNLYALSTASGALQWKFALAAQVRASAPAVDANGTIYIGSYDHNIYAVSQSGSLVRTYASDDDIRSSPVISGTMMYFGSEDHKVYAFNIGVGADTSDWPMYQYNADRPGRAVTYPPSITEQPGSVTVAAGAPFTLSVTASGVGALSYQWDLNSVAIAGAVSSTYTVTAASASDAGTYTVTVMANSGSVTSSAVTVTVSSGAPAPGKLVNLSARANVGTGGNILIAGFVIQGTGNKDVVLRGVGPTLGLAPFNVPGALAAPQLTLIGSATGQTITSDTSWGGSAALAAAFSEVGAFALATTSADSAVEVSLPSGSYTSQVSGIGATFGVALAEIYDADLGSTASSLVNLSARANVGTGGNILIAGFVIEGSQPVTVLLRGVGPTLGTAPFNVAGVLAQPQIDLFNSANVDIQSNAGWNSNPALSAAFAATGAFALPAGSADAAMIATLSAGSYTLQMSGLNGSTGIGLVEVYVIP
jgi:outer membrane protein assembly factor BamB/subtilisin family serine protease